MDYPVLRDYREKPVPRGRLGHRANPDRKARRAKLDKMGCQAHRVSRGRRDLPVRRVFPDRKGLRGLPE